MSMAIRLVARLGPGSSGMVENRPSAPRPAGGIGTAEAKLLLVLGIGAHDLGDQRVAHHIGLAEADEGNPLGAVEDVERMAQAGRPIGRAACRERGWQ